MDSANWLLQHDQTGVVYKESYNRFIEKLSCLKETKKSEYDAIYKAWDRSISPASTEEQLVYIEAMKLIKKLEKAEIRFDDDSSLNIKQFKEILKIMNVASILNIS